MSKLDTLVQDFLTQKKIAIVGVSDKRETGCNLGYRKFKDAGYKVYAVNPRMTTFEGDPCYPDLKSVPQKPDAVFIFTSPKVTELIVQECVDLGIKRSRLAPARLPFVFYLLRKIFLVHKFNSPES